MLNLRLAVYFMCGFRLLYDSHLLKKEHLSVHDYEDTNTNKCTVQSRKSSNGQKLNLLGKRLFNVF